MRVQDQIKFCGTLELNGVMTDVYDTANGSRLMSGIYPNREQLSEEDLTKVLEDPRAVVLDWRE